MPLDPFFYINFAPSVAGVAATLGALLLKHERDVLRHDVILFGVEPLTKRSQGVALLSAAPLAPREKSEIFPAGTPGEITKCRTEGIAIATRSVNRVGQDGSAPAMRHLIA